jgi:DNA invertase Pin-like site-specific DNA recombinase
MKKIAYSYIRFSSDAQAKGDSFRRQTELSRAYCIQNDLSLDEHLNLKDLGVSAFRSKNLESNLGKFLEAIQTGYVKPGSFLIVESLDRLSRDNISTALKLLGQ